MDSDMCLLTLDVLHLGIRAKERRDGRVILGTRQPPSPTSNLFVPVFPITFAVKHEDSIKKKRIDTSLRQCTGKLRGLNGCMEDYD